MAPLFRALRRQLRISEHTFLIALSGILYFWFMVKQITVWFCCMFMPLFAMSQTVIRESVGPVATSYSSDRIDIQSCIGQPYNTSVVKTSDHRPGFIQPQTEITSFEELISIKLYPNPTSGDLYFSLDKEMTNMEVVVTDLMGNEIFYQNYQTLLSGFTDCSEWASGMYFIQLRQNDNVLGKGKIIKINYR